MVDKQTTLLGRADSSAVFTAAMTARDSGKLGAGSNSEGGKMKTPSVPVNAAVSEAGSCISARAISQPCDAQKRPFAISRMPARTGQRSATRAPGSAPPTYLVIPVIAYIVALPNWG